ncbi:MAG: hypothetical protein LBH81_02965 [Rickettsiales bacterium]|jgi:hypothetical protein|nr:hypothetical protein [Rickettsiales bacterium]
MLGISKRPKTRKQIALEKVAPVLNKAERLLDKAEDTYINAVNAVVDKLEPHVDVIRAGISIGTKTVVGYAAFTTGVMFGATGIAALNGAPLDKNTLRAAADFSIKATAWTTAGILWLGLAGAVGAAAWNRIKLALPMRFQKHAHVMNALGGNRYELDNNDIVDLTRALAYGECGKSEKLMPGDCIKYRRPIIEDGIQLGAATVRTKFEIDRAAKKISSTYHEINTPKAGEMEQDLAEYNWESALRGTFTVPEQIKLLRHRGDIFSKAFAWTHHMYGTPNANERVQAARREILCFLNTRQQ